MLVSVRAFTHGDDAELLRRGLRPHDEREALKAAGMSGAEALRHSLDNSDQAFAIRLGGSMAAILGVGSTMGVGIPWLLAHPDFEKPAAAVPMARLVRRFIEHWLAAFGRLENHADPEHAEALKMLRWMGFCLEPARVAGPLGHELVYFWRERPKELESRQKISGGARLRKQAPTPQGKFLKKTWRTTCV